MSKKRTLEAEGKLAKMVRSSYVAMLESEPPVGKASSGPRRVEPCPT